MPNIPELQVGGTTYDLHDKRVDDLKSNHSALPDVLEPRIYSRFFMRNLTPNKVLQTSTGKVVSGGSNNFVFDSFVAIPKGIIYFAFPSNEGFNVVFYDINFSKVDSIYVDNSMGPLFGRSYNNTSACYMKVGGWLSGGFAGDINECFVYTYNGDGYLENEYVPLYVNRLIESDDYTQSQIGTSIIYAEEDLAIERVNSDYLYGVYFYNDVGEITRRYYAADIIGYTINAPKGSRFKVYIKRSDNSRICETEEVIGSIKIRRAKDNVGWLSVSGNSNVVTLSEKGDRIGTISPIYAETDLLLTCRYFRTLATYNIALYRTGSLNEYPFFMCYGDTDTFYIPKGVYYRYCVGRLNSDDEPTTEDWIDYISIEPVPKNTPEIGAVISEAFKNRSRISDPVPSYYSDHLLEKAVIINNLKSTDTVQFMFVTDFHQGTYDNTYTFRSVATDLIRKTNVGMVFNGGDTWTSGHGQQSVQTVRDRLIDGVNNTIPDTACDWFFVIGNHDTGLDYLVQGDDVTTFGPYFSTKELQYLMGGNITRENVKYDPNSVDMCFYVDKDDFRFIVLNNDLTTEGSSESGYNTLKFFIKALLNADGKTVIVLAHKLCSSSGNFYNDASRIADIVVAYNSRSTYQLATNQIARFDNCTGEIACLIGGHTHKDYSTTLSDGTPVIITTSTNAGAGEEQGEIRTRGTYLENAFDVFTVNRSSKTVDATRVGAGNDRHFDY